VYRYRQIIKAGILALCLLLAFAVKSAALLHEERSKPPEFYAAFEETPETSDDPDATGEAETAPKADSFQPPEILREIKELREIYQNPEIVGFLEVEGTRIKYPVVRHRDNDFYLTRDLRGADARGGSIFMDYENRLDTLDQNTVIYGHNMKDGSMFHDLRKYKDPAFFEKHRSVRLTTPYARTVWEVAAFMNTPIDLNYIQVYFPEGEGFAALLAEIKRRAAYDTGVTLSPEDRILNLSTCTGSPAEGGKRYVLCARLVSEE
jgi:sortase B